MLVPFSVAAATELQRGAVFLGIDIEHHGHKGQNHRAIQKPEHAEHVHPAENGKKNEQYGNPGPVAHQHRAQDAVDARHPHPAPNSQEQGAFPPCREEQENHGGYPDQARAHHRNQGGKSHHRAPKERRNAHQGQTDAADNPLQRGHKKTPDQNGTGNDASSDQWKQDENLDDLVKDEIQKENETVKNFDEISNPSGTDSTEDGYLISDVSLLIQPMAVSLSGSVVSEEQTETAEAETADEGEHELLAAAEQKSNLSAGEMTASAADDVSTLRAAGTILVGPDNYGTNKTSTPTPTATPSKSSSNNSSSNSNTGSTKIPQKKTQTTASIRSIPVNTGDETLVLPLAISSALSAAVMFCMAFLQMQAKRAKSMAAWLEFKKNHPFDEE